MRGAELPALPARDYTTHAAQALTDTIASDTATLEAVRSGKEIKTVHNHLIVKSRPASLPANPDSDIIYSASF